MRYAHMGGQNPPTIVIHGNKVDKTPADYRRYLENVFRKVYKLEGTPVKIEFKTSENPFEGRKSQVDERVQRHVVVVMCRSLRKPRRSLSEAKA